MAVAGLAIIEGGASTAAPFFRAAAQTASPDRTWRAMLAATALHAAALLWIAYHPAPAMEQPVISFTVTMTDLSVSENTVSTAASAASAPSPKPEQKQIAEETKPVTPVAAKKPVVTASPKTQAPLSRSSVAQTAVIAPVTPAQFDAAYLNNPKPSYPPLSRRLGEQGSVMLSVYVSEQGRAENVQLKKSSGYNRLDSAALEAVSRWRFAAARQGERLIASWVNVPVKFVLE